MDENHEQYSPERELLKRLPHDQLVDLLIRTERERKQLSNHYQFAVQDRKRLRDKLSELKQDENVRRLRDKLTGGDQ